MWLTCAALVAAIFVSGASDADVPANYCADMPYGGYKRHPSDCSMYVSCWSTTNFFTQSCQPGLLYDERAQACNYAGMVHCNSSPRPATPTRSPTTSFLEEVMTVHSRTTPRKPRVVGKTDGTRMEMVHAVHEDDMSNFLRVVTAPAAPILRNQRTGPDCRFDGLYPDTTNCTRYFICSFGRPYTFNCPFGTYFNPEVRRCDFLSGFSDQLCSQQQSRSPTMPTRNPFTTGSRSSSSHSSRAPTRSSTRSSSRSTVTAEDMLGAIANFFEEGRQEAKKKVNKAVKMEAKTAGGKAGQSAFHGVATFLGSNKLVKKMSLAAEQQLEMLKIIKERFELSKDEVKMVMEKMHSTLNTNPSRVVPDTPRHRIKMNMDTCPYPNDERRSRCRASSKYRTIDGSCNNLEHPLWGRSMTPFTRFIDPDYCDNIGCPRHGKFNRTLPGARAVSKGLFSSKPTTSHVHTTMLMSAGQMLDHDLTKTALSMISSDAEGRKSAEGGTLSEVTCGEDGCSTDGEENRACMPIPIPAGDAAFNSMRCLMFVRTQEVPQLNCQLGPRQQLNQLTHYMDASMCYGSTKEESDKLRTPDRSRGRLMMTRNPNPKFRGLLPQTDHGECRNVSATVKCFTAGDDRANENVALTSIHVVLARFHNDVESQLHNINPSWDGDRLFQETRRIQGAVWQNIMYNEYLPIILGPQAMSKYGLTLQRHGYSTAYDRSVGAEIGNVFATAAFRFSHSMIPDNVVFSDKNYQKASSLPLSMVLRRPYEMYNNARTKGSAVDSILHGIMSQSAMKVDRHFTKQVTQHLFSESPPHGPGTDLAAINIQRGRDHGLPSYNEWRKWCGLNVARNFEGLTDLPMEDRLSMKDIYDDVDDIDLFAGAICERNVAGGMVGPTFACILGRQFRNLKVGDRFWYETADKTIRFTPGQLNTIRKMTLSKLVCRASDLKQSESMVQKFAMLRPISEAFKELGSRNYAEVYSLASLYHGEQNERRPCSALPDIDMKEWEQ